LIIIGNRKNPTVGQVSAKTKKGLQNYLEKYSVSLYFSYSSAKGIRTPVTGVRGARVEKP
jgi:hypothetical protein